MKLKLDAGLAGTFNVWQTKKEETDINVVVYTLLFVELFEEVFKTMILHRNFK